MNESTNLGPCTSRPFSQLQKNYQMSHEMKHRSCLSCCCLPCSFPARSLCWGNSFSISVEHLILGFTKPNNDSERAVGKASGRVKEAFGSVPTTEKKKQEKQISLKNSMVQINSFGFTSQSLCQNIMDYLLHNTILILKEKEK